MSLRIGQGLDAHPLVAGFGSRGFRHEGMADAAEFDEIDGRDGGVFAQLGGETAGGLEGCHAVGRAGDHLCGAGALSERPAR